MSILLALHLLSAITWVGGMFFAYVCLRPAAAELLDPPLRLPLWAQVFKRFFKWVWLSIALLIISGHGMIGLFGGFSNIGAHIHIMLASGYLMMALFGHLFFNPYRKLNAAVSEERWPDAAIQLNKIRMIVGINLILGIFTAVIASAGKFIL